MNGKQGGDPPKLARALVEIVALDEPPLRWIAGADAVGAVEQKARRAPHPGRRPPPALVVARPRRGLSPGTPDTRIHGRADTHADGIITAWDIAWRMRQS